MGSIARSLLRHDEEVSRTSLSSPVSTRACMCVCLRRDALEALDWREVQLGEGKRKVNLSCKDGGGREHKMKVHL